MPTPFYVSYIALWLLLIVQGVLLLLVYRHFGLMAMGTAEGVQRDGLAVGEAAPSISGVTAKGEDLQWAPEPGMIHLLLFAAPGCQPCERVLPSVVTMAAASPAIGVAAIVPGRREDAMRLVEEFDLPFVCLAEDGSGAFDLYRVRVTPFGFVIGADGRILSKGLCSDPARLRGLFEAAGVEPVVPLTQLGAHRN
jgi:methylamine dehydrogenase accessory protein MauD